VATAVRQKIGSRPEGNRQYGGGEGCQGHCLGKAAGQAGEENGETWCCSCWNDAYLGFRCDPRLPVWNRGIDVRNA
jgi:hypothetical protein